MPHPALVVRAAKFVGGPVALAPGSSSRTPDPGMPVLFVKPEDVDATDGAGLELETRFFLHESRRTPQRCLSGYIGRLAGDRLDELLKLRGLGL